MPSDYKLRVAMASSSAFHSEDDAIGKVLMQCHVDQSPCRNHHYGAAVKAASSQEGEEAAEILRDSLSGRDIHGRRIPEIDIPAQHSHHLPCHGPKDSILASATGALLSSTALSKQAMDWYADHSGGVGVRAVPTAHHLRSLTAGTEEEGMWSLFQALLEDSERSALLHPDVIGIEKTPPHRRWFISQAAQIQHLLMHHPVLRIANTICLWLEERYRLGSRVDGEEVQSRLRSSEDTTTLQQSIYRYVRGGELQKAIGMAIACRHCSYSCLLSATQLQTVQEPWMTSSAVLPLFGEYGHGELAQSWTGNPHRLDALSQLYVDSCKHVHLTGSSGPVTTMGQFDAVLSALMSGHLRVLETVLVDPFASSAASSGASYEPRWYETVWIYLRCQLVVAFTKQLMTMGHRVAPEYTAYINSCTGTSERWAEEFSASLVTGLEQRLLRTVPSLQSSSPHYTTPSTSNLMLRLMLQFLGAAKHCQSVWLRPLKAAPSSGADARRLAHCLLLLDMAYEETLISYSVQITNVEELCAALCQHVAHLSLLNVASARGAIGSCGEAPSSYVSITRGIVAIGRRLSAAVHRAHVYAAFLVAVREVTMEDGMPSEAMRAAQEATEFEITAMVLENDPESAVVKQEILRVLRQNIHNSDLLTHHKVNEVLLWQAMQAATWEEHHHVASQCLLTAHHLWCHQSGGGQAVGEPASPQDGSSIGSQQQPQVDEGNGELEDALVRIADVSALLQTHVLPALIRLTAESEEAGETSAGRPVGSLTRAAEVRQHIAAAEFWRAMAESRIAAMAHTRTAGELGSQQAAAPGSSTLINRLLQEERVQLRQLVERTREGLAALPGAIQHPTTSVYHSSSMIGGVSLRSAAAWLVQQLTEDFIISFIAHSSPELEGMSDVTQREDLQEGTPLEGSLAALQLVFELVDELNTSGCMETDVLLPAQARQLWTRVQTLRVTYGQYIHARHVHQLRQQKVRQ